jgi:sensor histidine kinase YesM
MRQKGNMFLEQTADRPTTRHYFTLKQVLLDLLYTAFINTAIAIVITFTGVSKNFLVSFVMSQSYGIPTYSAMLFLFYVSNPNPRKIVSMALIVAAGAAAGILAGSQIGRFILQEFFSITLKRTELTIFRTVILWLIFGSAISYFFYSKARIKISKEIIQQERINRLSSEKERLEANLKLLQAQVEPHFLFNTLSNVLSLIDTDPTKGKSMLLDLIHYLRTSLSRTLPVATTLDQEMNIIKAYLNIQKVRMGERLRFTIELPDALREYPFPPMLLQPLVENAVKHGLEPVIEGGEITIRVAEKNGLIRIEVQDTGNGFNSYDTAGVGITNVRERIRLLYGDEGRLMLEANVPHGVTAIIEVPKRGV